MRIPKFKTLTYENEDVVLDFSIDSTGCFCYKTSERTDIHAYTKMKTTRYNGKRIFMDNKTGMFFSFDNASISGIFVVLTQDE